MQGIVNRRRAAAWILAATVVSWTAARDVRADDPSTPAAQPPDETPHSSFLRWVHVDGLWLPGESDAGVFGLVGAGRTETFKIVAGVLKRDFFYGGEVLLKGKPVRYRVPAPAVQDGVAYVTEDRKVEGFFETMSIARNVYLGLLSKFPGGRFLLSRREADQTGDDWISRLKVRAISPKAKVVELSGGNQQKVVIGRWLLTRPSVLLLDDPTRGIDVGAKAELYRLMDQLCRDGLAIIVTSSELPELLTLCDRILVLCEGRQTGHFLRSEATEQRIMEAATDRA